MADGKVRQDERQKKVETISETQWNTARRKLEEFKVHWKNIKNVSRKKERGDRAVKRIPAVLEWTHDQSHAHQPSTWPTMERDLLDSTLSSFSFSFSFWLHDFHLVLDHWPSSLLVLIADPVGSTPSYDRSSLAKRYTDDFRIPAFSHVYTRGLQLLRPSGMGLKFEPAERVEPCHGFHEEGEWSSDPRSSKKRSSEDSQQRGKEDPTRRVSGGHDNRSHDQVGKGVSITIHTGCVWYNDHDHGGCLQGRLQERFSSPKLCVSPRPDLSGDSDLAFANLDSNVIATNVEITYAEEVAIAILLDDTSCSFFLIDPTTVCSASD